MSTWSFPGSLCEWGLPAERAPIIKRGQWSQVTCLYDRAWPQWPLWPVLQWEIMHRLCRSPNSPACPEQGPSPLRGSTLKTAEGWGNKLYPEYRDVAHKSCGRFDSYDSHALIVKLSLSVLQGEHAVSCNISSNGECHTEEHFIVD